MTNIEIARHMTIGGDAILSRDSLHALAAILVCRKYKKGERILKEGEVCTCLRYIEKGMLRQFYFKYEKMEPKIKDDLLKRAEQRNK